MSLKSIGPAAAGPIAFVRWFCQVQAWSMAVVSSVADVVA